MTYTWLCLYGIYRRKNWGGHCYYLHQDMWFLLKIGEITGVFANAGFRDLAMAKILTGGIFMGDSLGLKQGMRDKSGGLSEQIQGIARGATHIFIWLPVKYLSGRTSVSRENYGWSFEWWMPVPGGDTPKISRHEKKVTANRSLEKHACSV
ncbi:hypothetical protein BDM02DRAFT_3132055 [Thelephora ganbajun]|uniref:Uncharacterized protein n=1 Tax=Thelephora ganbajun TaxID=370292 RepID=A0ACB6Z490_THEGA|nr:hypothetical protein BDM02DRAFT_3132055 [Thelephora ganbajun]